MSHQQKAARYVLIVAVITVAVYVLLSVLISSAVAPTAMVILTLTAGVPVLFSESTRDEREIHISRRATTVAGVATYLFLVVTCMGTWFTYFGRSERMIDVDVLPMIVMGAWVVMLIAHACTVLVLSNRPLDLAE